MPTLTQFTLGALLLLLPVSQSFAQLVFVRGSDNGLWMREATTWTPLGGVITSAPDAASWSADRVDVFARGADNGLVQMARIGDQWTSWVSLGGSLHGGPTAVSWGPNRLDVFAVGADRAMMHKSWDGTSWSQWSSLGGEFPANSTPDATSRGPGRIDVFARGMDGAIWCNTFQSGTWSGWHSLGGTVTSDPGAVAWGPDRIDVFARNTQGEAVQIAFDGANWGQWFVHGGRFAAGSGLDASSLAPNRLEVYGRGADNALVRKAWNGGQWSEWESLGGVLSADPSAIARVNGVRFLAEADSVVRRYGAHQRGAVSIGIVDRTGRVYFLNYGEVEPGVAASETSVYSVGSVSKVLTGTMVKLLNDEGRIASLDDHAQHYLPAAIQMPIFYQDREKTIRRDITVRQLLQHTSGLPRNFSQTEPLDMRLQNFVRLFSTVDPVRGPGEQPEYSNIGSEVLTAMVEHLDQRSYGASLLARLAKPLAMTSTAPNLVAHPRLPPHKIGFAEGGGYVQSTTQDMVKFMRAASRAEANPISRAILSAQSGGLFWFGNILADAFHHNGKNPALDSATWGLQQSGIMADPQSGMGVVVLTQNRPDNDMGALNIAQDIIRWARTRPGFDVYNW